MHDPHQQRNHRQQSGTGDAHEHETHTDQQHLNERDAYHALGHRADGCGAELGDAWAALRSGKARGDGQGASFAVFAIGHEHAGNDQGADEQQKTHTNVGHFAQQGQADGLDVGHQLHEHAAHVGGGLHPVVVERLANERQRRDFFAG
ncbi:hypothetical protein D9M71_197640 [compost metagenome]